jgi:hypothetical protein
MLWRRGDEAPEFVTPSNPLNWLTTSMKETLGGIHASKVSRCLNQHHPVRGESPRGSTVVDVLQGLSLIPCLWNDIIFNRLPS